MRFSFDNTVTRLSPCRATSSASADIGVYSLKEVKFTAFHGDAQPLFEMRLERGLLSGSTTTRLRLFSCLSGEQLSSPYVCSIVALAHRGDL